MVGWIGHITRLREIVLTGELVAKEPLRIGSGKGTKLGSPIDLPLLRVHLPGKGYVPFIPGSSLKGVFRSYFDMVIRSLGGYTCTGSGSSTCMSKQIVYQGNIGRLEKIARNLSIQGRLNELAQLLWSNLCLSCKVFGSQSYRSKIVFHDSYPIGDVRVGVKPGIAIDRRTGAAARGALYQVEYVEPGTRFSFRVDILDIPNYAVGLFAQGILDMNAGLLKIGGFKTRGFGWVELVNPAMTIVLYKGLGDVKENEITLKPVDEVDDELTVRVENVSVTKTRGSVELKISGSDVWVLLNSLAQLWQRVAERVVKAHKVG